MRNPWDAADSGVVTVNNGMKFYGQYVATGDYLTDPVAPSTGVRGGMGAFNLPGRLIAGLQNVVNTAAAAVTPAPSPGSPAGGGGLPVVPLLLIAGAGVAGFMIWKKRKKGRR
jgi:hypothetical protein